ncbi:MAG: succinate dehydrogenase assembly factor 2 [Actinobacillus minor]|nr:succinate dehydrogenase assembly factor 2 [Actinobacillus minor]
MAEINRFKLEWACRRGMRELDKMIMPFYQNHFDSLTAAQQQTFAEMLIYPDPELFRWVMHQLPAPTQGMTDLIELMRSKIDR